MSPERQGNAANGAHATNGRAPIPPIRRGILQRSSKALELLVEAHVYAQDVQRSAWQFALDVETLRKAGLSVNDIRWLLCQGYVQHGYELTLTGDDDRVVRPAGAMRFDRRSCLIITEAGLKFAREQDSPTMPPIAPTASTNGEPVKAEIPRWDRDRQELRVGSAVVKRYKSPAHNQELILAAFEEEGWPVRIDDPLPPNNEQDPRRRLHDTINSLNRNQRAELIRFTGDGSGQGVRWEFMSSSDE